MVCRVIHITVFWELVIKEAYMTKLNIILVSLTLAINKWLKNSEICLASFY